MSLALLTIIVLGGVDVNRPTIVRPVAECPAITPAGRRLVHLYASDQMYERIRARDGIGRVAPDRVQRLEDTSACVRILQLLEERAQSVGGTTASSRPEIYTAGSYYYAVIPSSPTRCRGAKPGRFCVGGWQMMHVFDRDFNLVGGAAM